MRMKIDQIIPQPQPGNTDCDKARRSEVFEGSKRTLASRPEFYLIYLLFYFVPWLFRPPSLMDVAVAVVAILVFLPIHFRAFEMTDARVLPLIVATALIGFATAPFNGMSGVFHVYASTQAGFQRPTNRALLVLVLLAITYLVMSYLMQISWPEIGFVLFIGGVTGVSCMSGAEQIIRLELAAQTRELAREQAAIAERERIARDLHDVLGHTLTMVALKSDIAERIIDTDVPKARQEIREIREATRDALRDVRAVVAGMALTTVADEIARAQKALRAAEVTFSVSGSLPEMTDRQETMVGLAIREAITNIVRHAQASKADLIFEKETGVNRLILRDNGKGGAINKGAGLQGLSDRLTNIGGKLTIEGRSSVMSAGQTGTTLIMSWPDRDQDNKSSQVRDYD